MSPLPICREGAEKDDALMVLGAERDQTLMGPWGRKGSRAPRPQNTAKHLAWATEHARCVCACHAVFAGSRWRLGTLASIHSAAESQCRCAVG